MSKPTATDGPVHWDAKPWGYDPEQEAPWLVNEAGDQVLSGQIKCREANARLLAAAYNAFDSVARRSLRPKY